MAIKIIAYMLPTNILPTASSSGWNSRITAFRGIEVYACIILISRTFPVGSSIRIIALARLFKWSTIHNRLRTRSGPISFSSINPLFISIVDHRASLLAQTMHKTLHLQKSRRRSSFNRSCCSFLQPMLEKTGDICRGRHITLRQHLAINDRH